MTCSATPEMKPVNAVGLATISGLRPLATIALMTIRWFSARSRSPFGRLLRSRTNQSASSPAMVISPLG